MKQFIKNNKVTYNLMSFTAYKALIMFSLLTESPKSYAEINEYFFNHPYLREKISIDTMRVYMNSLKRIGCEIKRVRGEDKVSRYKITAHPFELELTNEQIQSITKVYKTVVKSLDIEELIAMDKFFKKIGKYIKDEKFLYNITSPLKDVNMKLLENLSDCCKKKEQIVISYNSPNSGVKDIELATDKLGISNGKIYIYGFGLEYNQYSSFLVSRVKEIKAIRQERTIPDNYNEIKVMYELKCDVDKISLEENEKIIKTDKDKTIIEVTTTNEFLLKQRLLEYGSTCKVIGPEEFKNKFIEILKDMKAGYYCG